MSHQNLLKSIDELNVIVNESYGSGNEVDDVLSCLIRAYREGFDSAEEMLEMSLMFDIDGMRESIYQVIDGEDFADRVRRYVDDEDEEGLRRLATNEYIRVYTSSVYRHGTQDEGVYKTFITMRDDRVRDTHDYLDGVTIPIAEEFYTFDGDHGLYPHGFQLPENNVNCRCTLNLSYGQGSP